MMVYFYIEIQPTEMTWKDIHIILLSEINCLPYVCTENENACFLTPSPTYDSIFVLKNFLHTYTYMYASAKLVC